MLNNFGVLREPRLGIMLHYDASGSDAGAVQWLTKDPACRVSYNVLVLDNGSLVYVTPQDARAWHAGVCRPSNPLLKYTDANSAFYGLSIAAKPGDAITPVQRNVVIGQIKAWFGKEKWPLSETWRITSHHLEAWPRGRKMDITGVHGFDLDDIRRAVAG